MIPRVVLYSALVLALFHFTSGVDAQQCVAFNSTLLAPHPPQITIICQPNYNIWADDNTNVGQSFIFTQLEYLWEYFAELGYDPSESPVPESCIQSYVAFYCAQYYPPCTNGTSRSAVSVCATGCHNLTNACAKYLGYFTNATVTIPTTDTCDYTYSQSANCTFNYTAVDMEYWFGDGSSDPTLPPPTLSPPTQAPNCTNCLTSSEEEAILYPGGPLKGGILGAGLLVGLLMFVGAIGLFMKRQEKK